MLNDLKFVAGAVAKKDFVPALQFFRIKDGSIRSFNGTVAISTPTDLAVTAVPKGASFIKAIENIPDGKEIVLNLTAAGRLSVKSGNFRAYVECLADEGTFPDVSPSGALVPLPNKLLAVLQKVAPFMSVDASRPWSRGVLLRGQSALATNNIVLIEHWIPLAFPVPLIIPADAVKEILRIGLEPSAVQVSDTSITFHYPSGAWLLSSLVAGEWPDLTKILDKPSNAKPFVDGFFDGVNRLDAFTDKTGRLYLNGGTLTTSENESDGAAVDLEDFGGIGCHFLPQLSKLDGVATEIDFSLYPGPCLFFGNDLRGAIIGLRMNDSV